MLELEAPMGRGPLASPTEKTSEQLSSLFSTEVIQMYKGLARSHASYLHSTHRIYY